MGIPSSHVEAVNGPVRRQKATAETIYCIILGDRGWQITIKQALPETNLPVHAKRGLRCLANRLRGKVHGGD